MDKLHKIMLPASAVAFVINIWLLIFAGQHAMHDLEILSICNMILLSFVLLRQEDE